MVYRFLGNTGLKVSVLSYGTWLTAEDPKTEEQIIECVKVAWEHGINTFDTAESYGFGISESVLGKALKALPCKRKDYIVISKYINVGDGVNDKMLSAKHIYEGVLATLERMQLDYLDIIFAHRPDFDTPLEETCRAFDQLI